MKTQLHPDVLARRGRVQGYVFTQRRGTNLARNFVVPTNPQSDIQQDVRGSFAAAAAVWGTVDAAEAAAWEAFALNYTRLNNVGVYVTMTGIEACVMVNTYRLMDGQTVATTPPAYNPINDIVALIGLTLSAGNFQLSIGVGTIPNDAICLIRLTPAITNPVLVSQDGDYRIPTLVTEDSMIVTGTPSGSQYNMVFQQSDCRPDWDSLIITDTVRVHCRILDSNYCPPSLPPNAYNASGIVTIA